MAKNRLDNIGFVDFGLGEPSKANLVPVEGSLFITLVSENGNDRRVQIKIAPGYPTIRPIRGKDHICNSQDFMDFVLEKRDDLPDHNTKIPLLFSRSQAIELLARLTIGKSNMIIIIE